MGLCVCVRGWLECDATQQAAIEAIIAAHDDGHYSAGWGAPRRVVDGMHCVFYGATIRESGVDWLIEQVREIAALPASDADGDRVAGLFFAGHEMIANE